MYDYFKFQMPDREKVTKLNWINNTIKPLAIYAASWIQSHWKSWTAVGNRELEDLYWLGYHCSWDSSPGGVLLRNLVITAATDPKSWLQE